MAEVYISKVYSTHQGDETSYQLYSKPRGNHKVKENIGSGTGFSDEEQILNLLERCSGDVDEVCARCRGVGVKEFYLVGIH